MKHEGRKIGKEEGKKKKNYTKRTRNITVRGRKENWKKI